jgi:hypothetical protein
VPPRTRIASQPGGFFDAKLLGSRLEDARERFKVNPMEIAQYIWPTRKPENARTDWYKCASPNVPRKKFQPGEVDRATQFFRERYGAQIPSLWPVIDWKEAEDFDAFRRLAATMAKRH